ncbi:MAG: hypothetical protein WBR29_03115 [Gammaproteobacteria bacterium]
MARAPGSLGALFRSTNTGAVVCIPDCLPISLNPNCWVYAGCCATVCAGPITLALGTATISEPAGCQGNSQNPQYATPPTVTLSAPDTATVQSAIAQVQAGAVLTAPQGAGLITLVQPNYPASTTVNAPATGSGSSTVSNLSGLKRLRVPSRHRSLAGLGATECAEIASATGSIVGYVSNFIIPGIGFVVGPAVSAIVGLVEGLFGAKKAIPLVSAQDIAQAQAWYSQYNAIAMTTVGRNFTASSIQDMITAEAILNPGFWGQASSNQLSIPDVTDFYSEVMTRVNDFLTAVAAAAVGATISIHDDPTIQGHYPSEGTYFPAITYTFISPGINAPSYVLGPLFAQYFYTMCRIFDDASQCSGHLNPPMPQFYTDLIDYVRAAHAGWDTPQPNVIGVVTTIAAPMIACCGSGIESEAIAPLCIPFCELACASATPGTGVPPVVMIPQASTICVAHPCAPTTALCAAPGVTGIARCGSPLVSTIPGQGLSSTELLVLAAGIGIFVLAMRKKQ